MELLKDLHIAQSNQSQLIKVKFVQSFKGALRTYLKIY